MVDAGDLDQDRDLSRARLRRLRIFEAQGLGTARFVNGYVFHPILPSLVADHGLLAQVRVVRKPVERALVGRFLQTVVEITERRARAGDAERG